MIDAAKRLSLPDNKQGVVTPELNQKHASQVFIRDLNVLAHVMIAHHTKMVSKEEGEIKWGQERNSPRAFPV